MSEKKEKWLDELISRAINEGEPQFDPEKWRQKYPEELEMLKSRAGQASSVPQPNIWRIIFKSPITKFAAAAVIIIAIAISVVHMGPGEQVETPDVGKVAKSPAELMTMASLTLAYRRGGIEAVEEICDKAFKLVGPRPTSLSVQQLLEEFNGT